MKSHTGKKIDEFWIKPLDVIKEYNYDIFKHLYSISMLILGSPNKFKTVSKTWRHRMDFISQIFFNIAPSIYLRFSFLVLSYIHECYLTPIILKSIDTCFDLKDGHVVVKTPVETVAKGLNLVKRYSWDSWNIFVLVGMLYRIIVSYYWNCLELMWISHLTHQSWEYLLKIYFFVQIRLY